jgi:hypothetical protein
MVFCGWQEATGSCITHRISRFKLQHSDQRVLTIRDWPINVPVSINLKAISYRNWGTVHVKKSRSCWLWIDFRIGTPKFDVLTAVAMKITLLDSPWLWRLLCWIRRGYEDCCVGFAVAMKITLLDSPWLWRILCWIRRGYEEYCVGFAVAMKITLLDSPWLWRILCWICRGYEE